MTNPRPSSPNRRRPESSRHRLLYVALVVGGCTTCPDTSPEALRSVEAQIAAATLGFQDAQRERDVDRLVAALAPNFYMYHDGRRLSRNEVEEQMRASLPTQNSFDPTWQAIEVHVLGPNDAMVTFTFDDRSIAADGTASHQRGACTLVWQRVEEHWRIRYVDADHYPVTATESAPAPAKTGSD